MSTYLISGANGQLGQAFLALLGSEAIPIARTALLDPDQLLSIVREHRPEALINCAAYTQVDQAEVDSAACYAANAALVANLAKFTQQNCMVLVQISTDYVFDAVTDRITPISEEFHACARGIYALSKIAGESAAAINPHHFIVRTCGLYGVHPRRANFVEAMLRLGKLNGHVRVVNDQTCSPSYAVDVASAVLFLLGTANFGTYHVVNFGALTWCEFASEIFRQANLDVPVIPISTSEFNARAPRPIYSVLDTKKFHALGGPKLPAISDALSRFFEARKYET